MKTDAKFTPFQQALLDSVSKDYAHIPPNDCLEDPFSDAFKAWAKTHVQSGYVKRIRTLRVVKRVLIAAAILLLLAATAMAIPAVRTAILDLFFHENQERIAITFDPEQAVNAPDTIQKTYSIDYVPGGYTLSMKEVHISTVYLCWIDADGHRIFFTQQPLQPEATPEDWWGYNAAEHTRDKILLGDYQVERIQTMTNYKLVWTNNEYLFTLELSYSVTEEEMRKIFDSRGPMEE